MAKAVKKRASHKRQSDKKADQQFHFPLGKTNLMIILGGVLVIIVAYILMAVPDHPDDFLTRTLAPVLLVVVLLVVIPIGIMFKDKSAEVSKPD